MPFAVSRRGGERPLLPVALAALVGTTLALSSLDVSPLSAQTTSAPITAADLLAIKSVTADDFSPDGRWLALRIGVRSDGLGYVAAREGDPSYTRPSGARVLLLDSRTGDTTVVLSTPRTIGDIAWSRDGSRLAIVTRDAVPALLLWEQSTRRLRMATPAGMRLAENSELRWMDDGRLVVSVREAGWQAEVAARFDTLVRGPVTVQVGGEPFLAWDALRRLGNRALVVALTPSSGKVDTLLGPTQLAGYTVTRNGRALSWREDLNKKTNYDGGPANEARLMARAVGQAPRVLLPSLRGVSLQVSELGEHYAYARDGAIYAASLTDSAARRIIGPTPRAPGDTARAAGGDSTARSREERYSLVRMSPSGDAVVVSSRNGLSLVELATGARRSLSTVTDTVAGPRVTVSAWTDDGRTLYLAYAARTSWDRALIRIDRTTGAADTLVRDGRLYGTPRLSADGSQMAITIGANGQPADLWLAGAKFEQPRRVLASNPQLAARTLPRTQLVTYLDADGRAQFGVLTLPPGNAKALPTVFSVYENFFDDSFDATTMYLASNGYAVMKPSVTFETGYPGEAWLKGVTASANKLIEMGIADSAKLGVHGTSYGGYATNLLVTQTNRFKAAINISGKVDMISFYTDSPRLGVRNVNAAEKTQDRIGATMWEQPQKYVQHSAIMFADRIRTPLLLMTGGEDHNVPALNTREMYFALRRLGRTVEWVNYANGGHGIPMTNAAEFSDWHSRLLGWYDRYLKAKADGATPKATTSQTSTSGANP